MAELWSLAATGEAVETLEWRTDVLRSREGEQRVALRRWPRETLALRHRLDNMALGRAAEVARAGFGVPMILPLWHMAQTPAAAVARGDTSLPLDTALADFRAGGGVAVAVDGGPAALAEIASVDPGALILTAPLDAQLPAGPVAPGRVAVMPAREAVLAAPMDVARRRASDTMASTRWILRGTADPAPWDGPMLAQMPIVDAPSVMRRPLASSLSRAVEYVDNGAGAVAVEPVRDVFERGETITLRAQGAAERWALRRRLWAFRGRQARFWLPSWGREVRSIADISLFSELLRIQPVGPLQAMIGRGLALEVPGGPVFRAIVDAFVGAQGEDTLRMDERIGGFPAGLVAHLMVRSRSDADRFEIRHGRVASEVSFPVVEVAQ